MSEKPPDGSLNHWQDKVFYFILIDRFYNGDKSNDDFGVGEYDPGNGDCFQGGDLKGIAQKLPFIKKMGFDAIWITPPVHNQWINPGMSTRGYHGYWAYDFTEVDPHFGSLQDYKKLVDQAHQLGLKVIQDIVVNHAGNYFTVENKDYDPKRPELNWKSLDGAYPPGKKPKAPRDPLFRMNNPNVREHKEAGIYNFTPNISDFNDRKQTLTYSLGDLDDLNLNNPAVINRLKNIYRYWINEIGIDGFRVDTVYYTPEAFYGNFLYDRDPRNLGIKRFAKEKGIKDFFIFGEVWSYDYKAINKYISKDAATRLDSAIDIPLQQALAKIFYRKSPTEEIRPVLGAERHNRNLWMNFLDNHDTERMNSCSNWRTVQQSLAALFTLPGIPCIYYGSEAGFKSPRQNMFRNDYFDGKSKYSTFLKKLISFRKRSPAFSRGKCAIQRTSLSCGILSYSISYRDEEYLMIFNTSPDAMFYDLSEWGSACDVLLSSEGRKAVSRRVILAPESYLLLKRFRAKKSGRWRRSRTPIELEPIGRSICKDIIRIAFKMPKHVRVETLYLLSNDNYAKKMQVDNFKSGTFELNTSVLGNGKHRLRFLAKTKSEEFILSNERAINIKNPYRLLAEAIVPAKNKKGLRGDIHAPAEQSYCGQLSMEEVRIYSSGKDLKLSIKMSNVTNDWNPPNGYDHVYFNVFFDFPEQRGKRFFPKLNYSSGDFEFNAGFLLDGWGVRSFEARTSTKEFYGLPLSGVVENSVSLRDRTINFNFSSEFFNALKTFVGTKVFISTWDGYLGDLRRVSGKKEDWDFYVLENAATAKIPKVFDYLLVTL